MQWEGIEGVYTDEENTKVSADLDGYWNDWPDCQYAPDPSVFTCWWNPDSLWLDDGSPNPAVTECTDDKALIRDQEGAPTGEGEDTEDNVKFYLSFASWLAKGSDDLNEPIRDTIALVLKLEGRDTDAQFWKDQTTTVTDEPRAFRLYLEVLYKFMPKYTYLNYKVQRSRQCEETNYKFGAQFNTGGKGGCDDFGDGRGDPKQAQLDWPYWKKNNRHCTLLAQCDADMGYGGVTADSVEDPRWVTIFPINVRDRTTALAGANTAYFISIIIVQWADLMICKTRSRSLFEQGMTNVFMNYSLFFETCLGACLVYLPFCNQVFQTRPMKFVWWCAAVPFSIFIYVYDELRKGYIRGHRGSWLERNTYW